MSIISEVTWVSAGCKEELLERTGLRHPCTLPAYKCGRIIQTLCTHQFEPYSMVAKHIGTIMAHQVRYLPFRVSNPG